MHDIFNKNNSIKNMYSSNTYTFISHLFYKYQKKSTIYRVKSKDNLLN